MTGDNPLWAQAVTYAAVGGTRSADIIAYPPAGFRPVRVRRRIGTGTNRFDWAADQAMTWGIQRRSGVTVAVEAAPATAAGGFYSPVTFSTEGRPVAAAATEPDARFSADGTPYLLPGESAELRIRFLGITTIAPVRVVYVVDEPNRQGFAYGTLPGHPESGEESFIVEREADGSVWVKIVAFSRPSSLRWRMLGLPARVAQALYTRRYLRALSGPSEPS